MLGHLHRSLLIERHVLGQPAVSGAAELVDELGAQRPADPPRPVRGRHPVADCEPRHRVPGCHDLARPVAQRHDARPGRQRVAARGDEQVTPVDRGSTGADQDLARSRSGRFLVPEPDVVQGAWFVQAIRAHDSRLRPGLWPANSPQGIYRRRPGMRTARPQPGRPTVRLRDFSRRRGAGNPAVPGPSLVTGLVRDRRRMRLAGCYGRSTPSRPSCSWLMPAVNQSASVPPVVAVPGSRPHRPGSVNGLPVDRTRTWPVT
jgi:hypothetical protein